MEEEEVKEYINLGQLDEDIEKLEKSIPDKRTKSEYNSWKCKINNLYLQYNKMIGFKCYKVIE